MLTFIFFLFQGQRLYLRLPPQKLTQVIVSIYFQYLTDVITCKTP